MRRTTTSKLRALILEDEWPARNYLVELIEATGLGEVVGAIATSDEAREVLRRRPDGMPVDVLFVDVQLVGEVDNAGLELVRELARDPDAPALILATAYQEHALEAFNLGVVDYLLKPFNEERVEACMTRLHARRGAEPAASHAPSRVVARRGKSLVFLDPLEVWAFEAADRLTCVHTAQGTFDVDLSLAAIETSLAKAFVRVHRNWLVNASHIKQLDREGSETTLFVGRTIRGPSSDPARVASEPGLTVPVARERAHGIREMLLENAMGVRRV